MKAEIESLKREVRDLARLARGPRPPSPPRAGDVLVTAGLAAVGLKAWDHREELVGVLDEFLTDPEAEPLALGHGNGPPAEHSATGPAPTESQTHLWPPPGDLMRYTYVDIGSDDDLG